MAGEGGGWSALIGRVARRRAEAEAPPQPDPVVHVPIERHPIEVHAAEQHPIPAPASAPLASADGSGGLPAGTVNGGGLNGQPNGQPPYPARPAHPSEAVPWTLRVAAEGIWRMLIVGAGLYFLFRIIGTLRIVAFAFVAALLISALLQPTVSWFRRHGVPRGPATAMTFLGGLIGIALVAWFVVWQVSTNLNQVTDHVQTGILQIKHWLETGPMHLTDKQINEFANQLTKVVGTNSDQITSFGFSTVGIVVEIVTGVFLAAFCTFFLLYDGERIWGWTLRLLPLRSRMAMAGAGPRAWATLTAYVRGTVMVAFIDAVSIGIGIYLLGVPLAMPIAVIIFLGAFVPLVGALVTGTIAVLIGLVTHGIVTAALVLVVLLGVQQIEGHLLQPLILGRAVRIHPLAVILAVTCGSIVGGIGGAIVSVPLVAVTNTTVGYLRQRYHVDEDIRAALSAAASE
ncbi:AI-2E family transporter [Streptacidiphilus fuscans]|uniref:AI-2E family transporter n=1 Tax=Streptacidiphilus fuscans TaxID=2789292 RepID=A0A931B2F8_9ACTN|nr:AI-2E family transporter [Streptacidiphilus fuscans]MBF9067726.1 AI-2E family transporter [Streptacidiphilus fuscans]